METFWRRAFPLVALVAAVHCRFLVIGQEFGYGRWAERTAAARREAAVTEACRSNDAQGTLALIQSGGLVRDDAVTVAASPQPAHEKTQMTPASVPDVEPPMRHEGNVALLLAEEERVTQSRQWQKVSSLVRRQGQRLRVGVFELANRAISGDGAAAVIVLCLVALPLLVGAMLVYFFHDASSCTPTAVQRPANDELAHLSANGSRTSPPSSPLAATYSPVPSVQGLTPVLGERSAAMSSPRVPPMPIQQPAVQNTASKPTQLCPDLVVPPGSECTMLLPCFPAQLGAGPAFSFSIEDMQGTSVFKGVFVERESPGDGGLRRIVRAELMNVRSEVKFAHCSFTAGVADVIAIGQGSGKVDSQPFAKLSANTAFAEGCGFAAVTCTGDMVQFESDLSRTTVRVSDKGGRLLALVEPVPQSGKRVVRVGPGVDVGFMVLSLLGMDLLQQSS